jgi:hypothetical protein
MKTDPPSPEKKDAKKAPGRWCLVFEPLTSDHPVEARVGALLKRALRDWRLKCVHIGERPPEPIVIEAPAKPKRPRKPRRRKPTNLVECIEQAVAPGEASDGT